MIFYVCLTALALLPALFVQDLNRLPAGRVGTVRRGNLMSGAALCALFLVLVIPASLRINIGNDYAKYADFMHLTYANAYVPTEIGFNTLVKVVYSLCGFENYILVFAIFSVLTMGLFLAAIKRQADSFFLSFYLFLTFGYYFQTYNTVRYYLALAIALFAAEFLRKKRYVPFVCMILLAATFHKSVILVLVLYPLALVPFTPIMYGVIACLGALMTVLQPLVMKAVIILYPSYKDTVYLEDSGFSPAGIFRCLLCLALWCYVHREGLFAKRGRGADRPAEGFGAVLRALSRRERFFFNLNFAALVLNIFCAFLPILTRITTYLSVTQIFFLPMLIAKLPEETEKERRAKRILLLLLLLFGAATFLLYLRRMASPSVKILPYRTFLFEDMPKIGFEVND